MYAIIVAIVVALVAMATGLSGEATTETAKWVVAGSFCLSVRYLAWKMFLAAERKILG